MATEEPSRPGQEASGAPRAAGRALLDGIVVTGHGGEISVTTGDETVIEVRLPSG
jgi:hypothetical protein